MHYLYPRMRKVSDYTSIGTSILQSPLVHDKHEFTDLMTLVTMHANPARITLTFFAQSKSTQNMSNERNMSHSLIVQYCTFHFSDAYILIWRNTYKHYHSKVQRPLS